MKHLPSLPEHRIFIQRVLAQALRLVGTGMRDDEAYTSAYRQLMQEVRMTLEAYLDQRRRDHQREHADCAALTTALNEGRLRSSAELLHQRWNAEISAELRTLLGDHARIQTIYSVDDAELNRACCPEVGIVVTSFWNNHVWYAGRTNSGWAIRTSGYHCDQVADRDLESALCQWLDDERGSVEPFEVQI